jgi:hypothetical protein
VTSLFYEWIGRIVVSAIKLRYGAQVRRAAAAGVVLTALGLGAYLAARQGDTEA